jgi:hypothetical protein
MKQYQFRITTLEGKSYTLGLSPEHGKIVTDMIVSLASMETESVQESPEPEEDKITVAVYMEHCSMGGRQCHNQEMIDADSSDIMIFEGTPEYIYKEGQWWLDNAMKGAAGQHHRMIGNTLMNAGSK